MVMTTGSFDLLRERRIRLGEPEPLSVDPRAPLIKGTVIGGGLVGAMLLAGGVLALLNHFGASELESLLPVQGRYDTIQAQIQTSRRQRLALEKSNTGLAQALVAVRSGSALMEDLRRRAPQGVQYIETRVEQEQLRIRGAAADPGAFARINALQLNLQRSPLFDPRKVALIKANREEPKSPAQPAAPVVVAPVQFELTAVFRPRATRQDLATLRGLGAEGMALRLEQLQRQGVLR